jgi:hypothetical protein
MLAILKSKCLLISNVSENHTIFKTGVKLYQLNCCLRSEEGVYKADIVI